MRHTADVINCLKGATPCKLQRLALITDRQLIARSQSMRGMAKNVFQVHSIADNGDVSFNRALRRSQMLTFFARLDPCLVGIEAYGTSHHWARELIKLGHNVKLISPAYVKPYVKRGKSDAVDAAASSSTMAKSLLHG